MKRAWKLTETPSDGLCRVCGKPANDGGVDQVFCRKCNSLRVKEYVKLTLPPNAA